MLDGKTKTMVAVSTAILSCCLLVELLGVEPEAQAAKTSQANESFKTKISYLHPNLAGNKTASGEIYDPNDLTAAHKTLPFGTKVKVKNVENGKTVVLEINDRGPYITGRKLDVSSKAAKKLDFVDHGEVKARVTVID